MSQNLPVPRDQAGPRRAQAALRLVGVDDTRVKIDAAQLYIARRWPVVALHYPIGTVAKPACSCDRCWNCPHPGKHPMYFRGTLEHGALSATMNLETVREWFKKSPLANLGIASGARSNLLVLDIDPRNRGDETVAELVKTLGPLPDTVTSLTGGGGKHLLFKHPGGSVRGSLGSGVDVLGDGKLFVAPPSIHGSGGSYHWELSSTPELVEVAALPEKWQEGISLAIAQQGDREHRGDRGDRVQGGERAPESESRGATPVIPVVPVIPVNLLPPAEEWTVDRVLNVAKVRGSGQHDQATLSLARGVRLNLGIVDREVARPIFDRWHEESHRYFADPDYDTCWSKFVRVFDVAKVPLGVKDLFGRACAAAEGKPPPACADRVRSPRAKKLISACREMSLLMGGGPFKLSFHQIADRFGGSPQAASDLMHGLARDGILACVDRGKPGRPGHNAGTWKYIGDDFEALRQKGAPNS